MILVRSLLLVTVLTVAWAALVLWERRRPTGYLGLSAGVTLITGTDCLLCAPAVAAFRRAGIEPQVLDVADVPGSTYRSLPTALVVDQSGAVLAARSGRQAVTDAAKLARLSSPTI